MYLRRPNLRCVPSGLRGTPNNFLNAFVGEFVRLPNVNAFIPFGLTEIIETVCVFIDKWICTFVDGIYKSCIKGISFCYSSIFFLLIRSAGQ